MTTHRHSADFSTPRADAWGSPDSQAPRAHAWGAPDSQVEHCDASIAPASPPNKFAPKLDAAVKEELCRLITEGHTIAAAARQVGVSDRAVRYAAERDPVFKLRIGKDREKISGIVLKTLTAAAEDPEKWRATTPLMKLAYPERMNPKAGMLPIAEARMLLGVARDTFDAFLTDQAQRAQFGEHLTRAVANALEQAKSTHTAEDLLGG